MTRRHALAAMLTVALALAAPPIARAHPGHDHKVLGTVTVASTDRVVVKDKAGKDVTVHVTAETKVVQAKKPLKVDDIKPGMRVVITAVTVKEKDVERLVARTIELGSAPTSR